MEKDQQPDSLATVTIKPDYPPSEVYSSEPPPAYVRPQSSAVQVAKIIAVTVVLVSIVLGSFLLASAYVTANASCRQLEQELELLSEAADRFQPAPLQPEALVQDQESAQSQTKRHSEAIEDSKKSNDIDNNNIDNSDSSDSSADSNESDDDEDRTPIKFKLPLQLDFDDIAGALIEKNQKSRMNCIVEKKRAEEVVDHQPKTLRLPFGLNLTTDPRYEHVSGERMAIFCESGNVQRNGQPQNTNEDEDDDDDEEQTIMIQPVMIPIPQSHFPTHMAQQMPPQPPQQFSHMHPMETMRPPMPMPQQMPQPQSQSQLPPNQILHHIAQQIIAQKIMEAQRAREEQHQQQQAQQQQEQSEQRQIPQRFIPEAMMAQRLPPLPEEVLTQLNRLPNRNVIVAVSEQESDENPQENNGIQQEIRVVPQEIHVVPQEVRVVQSEMRVAAPQEPQTQQMRVVQDQRQSAAEMNGRQSYARGLPIHIPVHMIQQEQQEPQATASEESRPHYVHPRSLRSVDALIPKSTKRVKRCSCDCAC